MDKNEFCVEVVCKTDDIGCPHTVHDLGENKLVLSLLSQRISQSEVKIVILIKFGQIFIEYIDLSKGKIDVVLTGDWLVIFLHENKIKICLQFSSNEDIKSALHTFHNLNSLSQKDKNQIKILVDFSWQKDRVLSIARDLKAGCCEYEDCQLPVSPHVHEFVNKCLSIKVAEPESPNLLDTLKVVLDQRLMVQGGKYKDKLLPLPSQHCNQSDFSQFEGQHFEGSPEIIRDSYLKYKPVWKPIISHHCPEKENIGHHKVKDSQHFFGGSENSERSKGEFGHFLKRKRMFCLEDGENREMEKINNCTMFRKVLHKSMELRNEIEE